MARPVLKKYRMTKAQYSPAYVHAQITIPIQALKDNMDKFHMYDGSHRTPAFTEPISILREKYGINITPMFAWDIFLNNEKVLAHAKRKKIDSALLNKKFGIVRDVNGLIISGNKLTLDCILEEGK